MLYKVIGQTGDVLAVKESQVTNIIVSEKLLHWVINLKYVVLTKAV